MNRSWLIWLFLLMNIFGVRCIAHQHVDTDTYYVVFHVVFEETAQPVFDAEIRMEGSDGSLVTVYTDSAGYCDISNLSGENSYSLYIDKHLCFTERRKIRPHDSCFMNTVVEIRLVPIVIDFIHLPVFQFNHGSAKIKHDLLSSDVIEEINRFLKDNPSTILQINGYSEPDERSGLEKKRALNIYQYCIKAGADPDRIKVNTQSARHAVIRYNYDGCHPVPVNFFITKEFLKTRSKADRQRIRHECRQVRFEIFAIENISDKKNE